VRPYVPHYLDVVGYEPAQTQCLLIDTAIDDPPGEGFVNIIGHIADDPDARDVKAPYAKILGGVSVILAKLTAEQAQRWAAAVTSVAVGVHYAQAVWAQLNDEVKMPAQYAGWALTKLCDAVPAVDAADTGPCTFTPVVSAADGTGYIELHILGTRVGYWTYPDAMKHADAVMQAAATIPLDVAYLALLADCTEDLPGARNMVISLSPFSREVPGPPETP